MPYLFNNYYPTRDILFFLGEGLLVFVSMLLSILFFQGSSLFVDSTGTTFSRAVIVTLVFQLCLYFFDLYDLKQDLSMPDTATRLTQAFGLGCILLAVLYYLIPSIIISTRIFWVSYVITCAVLLIYRFLYYLLLRRRLLVQGVVVIGTGKQACEIAREIEGRNDSIHKILAFVGGESPQYNPNHVPVLESLDDIVKVLPLDEVERVIVAPDDRRGSTPVRTLMKHKMRGAIVEQGVSFYERITGKILVERIDPSWIIFSDGFLLGRWRYLLKRLLDVTFSLSLLLLSFPVMIISAIIIKLESSLVIVALLILRRTCALKMEWGLFSALILIT